ncbi:glycosyltransferase [Glacieibacterium sp.]|uniref:glycosyltransferase n=1 Tax=Glacieibacterium sp. TaxID=2860237 RepID=UPI003B00E2FD
MNSARAGSGEVRDVLLVDPSLFTAPYDAALSAGLEDIGLRPHWAVRQLRAGEGDDLGRSRSTDLFYPLSDGPRRRSGAAGRVLKGIEHVVGMVRLLKLVRSGRYDLVHFQWMLLPSIDARIIARMRRVCPVVLTVHDSTPFNGKQVSGAQRHGLSQMLDAADRIIVHTESAKANLVAQGVAPSRLAIVPHGVLTAKRSGVAEANPRWQIVLFGKLQEYKGVDVLVEAVKLLDPAVRSQLKIIVAGEPMIDMAPLLDNVRAAGLPPELLEFRLFRHSQEEMSEVLGSADAFVFPYRTIDASGVLFAVAPLGKWLIASELGAFSDLIGYQGDVGELVTPGGAQQLAQALAASIGRKPARDLSAEIPTWSRIASLTRDVYNSALLEWQGCRADPTLN